MHVGRVSAPAIGALAIVATGGATWAAPRLADPSHSPSLSDVAGANQRAAGYAPASRLSAELQQLTWAQGSTRLENPDGVVSFYGYENDTPSADDPSLPQMLPTPQNPTEAQK